MEKELEYQRKRGNSGGKNSLEARVCLAGIEQDSLLFLSFVGIPVLIALEVGCGELRTDAQELAEACHVEVFQDPRELVRLLLCDITVKVYVDTNNEGVEGEIR